MTFTNSEMIIGGLAGAVATGFVSLTIFFITQYFVRRDKSVDKNETANRELMKEIQNVNISIGGISARLDEHTSMLITFIKHTGHMSRTD